MKKGTKYEDLIEEALENAAEDRERAIEAFEKTKGIYNIDFNNPESMQGLMLLGQSIPKLLELAHKSNEQIIKLAQLREKEASQEKKSKKNSGPMNIDDIKAIFEEEEKKIN